MQLAYWFLGVALVSVGIGLIVASAQYFRGQMGFYAFSFTIVAFVGLAITAVARFVGAERAMSWIGLGVLAFAFYMLGRHKDANNPEIGHAETR